MSRSPVLEQEPAGVHDRAAVVVDAEARVLLPTPAAAVLIQSRPGTPCEPIRVLLAQRNEDQPQDIRLPDAAGTVRTFAATVTPMAANPGPP